MINYDLLRQISSPPHIFINALFLRSHKMQSQIVNYFNILQLHCPVLTADFTALPSSVVTYTDHTSGNICVTGYWEGTELKDWRELAVYMCVIQ
jgi:hypothetical protein